MGKPVTENLSLSVQAAVAGFNAAAEQPHRPGLSMAFPDLDVSLASNAASNNVPSIGSGTVREV